MILRNSPVPINSALPAAEGPEPHVARIVRLHLDGQAFFDVPTRHLGFYRYSELRRLMPRPCCGGYWTGKFARLLLADISAFPHVQ